MPEAAAGIRARRIRDRLVSVLLYAAAAASLLPLVLVLAEVVRMGLPAWSVAFFTRLPAAVGETGGGIANAIGGTALLVLMALALGAPLGVLAGIHLSEFAGSSRQGWAARVAGAVRVTGDVLAGVPTVVVGIVVYAAVVVPMHHFSALAGSLALAVVLVPTVVRVSEDMLRMVPGDLREAALALGVPRWRVVVTVALRAALPGILSGVALGTARVAGETAPLLFTAFGNPNASFDPLQPVAALPLQIYLYAISPYAGLRQQAWGAALLLILLVALANGLTRRLGRGRKVV